MHGFDLAQLRTFLVVAEVGSLTAAAPQVYLSQSAVSEQMRKLEDAAGQALLLRSKSGVVLTPAGLRLQVHAQGLVDAAEHAWRDLRGSTLQGRVRLGITDYFKPQVLAALLKRLSETHPRMRWQVQVGKSAEVEAAWSQGELDLALTMAVGAGPEGAVLLHEEALVWAVQAGAATDWPDGVPLVVLPPACALHQLSQRLLRAQGVAYEVMHTASGVAGLQAAVAAGLGVACLNQSALVEGMVALADGSGLPVLPQVQFQLLPLRAEATPLLAQVWDLLRSQWSAAQPGPHRGAVRPVPKDRAAAVRAAARTRGQSAARPGRQSAGR